MIGFSPCRSSRTQRSWPTCENTWDEDYLSQTSLQVRVLLADGRHRLEGHTRADEDAVLPVERLVHQRRGYDFTGPRFMQSLRGSSRAAPLRRDHGCNSKRRRPYILYRARTPRWWYRAHAERLSADMYNYNEKRIVDLEDTKAKDYIQRGPVEEMARQARLEEARQAGGSVRARARWARGLAVIAILVVVAAVLVSIFVIH